MSCLICEKGEVVLVCGNYKGSVEKWLEQGICINCWELKLKFVEKGILKEVV